MNEQLRPGEEAAGTATNGLKWLPQTHSWASSGFRRGWAQGFFRMSSTGAKGSEFLRAHHVCVRSWGSKQLQSSKEAFWFQRGNCGRTQDNPYIVKMRIIQVQGWKAMCD